MINQLKNNMFGFIYRGANWASIIVIYDDNYMNMIRHYNTNSL